MNRRSLLKRNLNVMYLNSFLGNLAFFLPVMTLFFSQITGSITLVALVFSTMAIVAFLLEIPTGALSDSIGRRKIMILGGFLTLAAISILAFSTSFYMLILFSVLFAVKNALHSGTQEAIVYESLNELGRKKSYKKVMGRIGLLGAFGGIIGAVFGGLMASYFIRLPFIMTIPIAIAHLILAFLIINPKYRKPAKMGILSHSRTSLRFVLKNKTLLLLFAYALFSFGVSESTFGLEQIFFNFVNVPVAYFGLIAAVSSVFAMLGFHYSERVSKRLGDKKALIFSKILDGFLIVMAAVILGYAGVFLLTIVSFFRLMGFPIQSHMLNSRIPSHRRATILSMNNMMNNIGWFIFSPFIGYLADIYNISTAFSISGVLLILSIVFLLFIKEKQK